jgi:hypothetical protein
MLRALLAFLFAAPLAAALTLPPGTLSLPPPTGPHAIGTCTFDWLDRSRPEKASRDPAEFRQLIVQVWYPAQSSETPPSPYVPRLNAYHGVWEQSTFDVAARVQTHSHLRAPPVKGAHFPVVLLSHGWEGTRSEYTSLAEDLASLGYAVFGVDHPYMGRVALPNGQVTPATEDQFRSPTEIMNYYGRDLQFAIDQIAGLDARDAILAHRLDLSRIAAIGHSSRFSAVSNACRRDPRIKACVNIDAPGYTAALFAGLRQPLLWIRLERAAPLPPTFLRTTTAETYDLQISNAQHDSVEDWNYLEASSQPERDRSAYLLSLLRSYIAAFLKKALAHQDSPLLHDTHKTGVTFTRYPLQ